MSNQELISRVFEAIRSDPQLITDIEELCKRRSKWKVVRMWDAFWFPFYSGVGLPLVAGTIRSVFQWTGTK